MAIYHFSGTVISRSQGRSAIACSAYRSAKRLIDERQDKVHDYTKKQDVAFETILTPDGAPDWMKDRETLWNKVEANERRKDAQLAREFHFSLPKELTIEQNIELAKAFVTQEFVSRGMIADLAVHNDKMPSGEFQPHAHVMLTMREITPEGFGQKVREWNDKAYLLHWREAWSQTANEYLFKHGFDIKIDHRTLSEQGIDLEPQYKIGAAVAKDRMARLLDHQRIARENGEKLLHHPEIALHALTQQHATFTHQDIARFVNRHSENSEQFQVVYEKVKASNQLVFLGLDEFKRERFTTKDMLELETRMLNQAQELNSREGHLVSPDASLEIKKTYSLTDEQSLAFEHLVSPGDLKNVIGYAGSGKSYLLGAAREAWEREGYCTLGATLSGIAAQNLEASSGIKSRTLASYIYDWQRGQGLLTEKDILIVDEAGMLGSRQLNGLLTDAKTHGAKIVLVGDPYQLQAIEAGAAFRAISDSTPTVSLTEIRRQKIAWQRDATVMLAKLQTSQALDSYNQHDLVHVFETQLQAKQELIALWNDVRINNPDQSQIVLTYTKADVRELNDLARDLRKEQDELSQDHLLVTHQGAKSFSLDDRIYFLKNDKELQVKNGTLGTILNIKQNTLTVKLDRNDMEEKRIITFDTDRYPYLDHGYAATIHKAQGVTVDRAHVLASRYMDAHAAYVALSRHRESVDVFYSREEFATHHELVKTLSRDRSKDVTLDYGFEREEKSLDKTPDYYERWFQEALKNEPKMQPQIDFSQIKKEFELSHPDEARKIQESLAPRHEKLAREAQNHIQSLERNIETSETPLTYRQELEKYASQLNKQTEVMSYLKQLDSEMSQKIARLAKIHEMTIDRGRDRGGRSY